ncbi:uncharacterized protein GGS22DRAFT_52523 [Annulohypoxylon maeteangense]|uniref:uncharacterized protein n=1 Tax=Annulohypoxylon maeteangense TaxID=1927788 RepID=UPI0020076B26|nr:uncharacterized protein GGS22DRAFT_52523 [Annulohypoxylon maeteangense]KAI0881933.1 hypothetical protein GGS22DRAFT_52523 [Annulohypoxylon maeteangense]
MAKTATRSQGVPLPSILEPPSLVVSDGEPSPTSDDAADEEQLYIDQDDAQSIIQPALSPVATRLTLPKTPAAEKAAALERLPGGGLFSVIEGTATPDPEPSPVMGHSSETLTQTTVDKTSTRQARGFSLGQLPSSHSSVYRFPSPWQSGPKQMVVQNESGSPKPTLSTVFGQDKHRRSNSGGADALKRIKEALPSMPSMPSMPSISLQSFFSGPSSAKSPSLDAKRSSLLNDSMPEPKQFTPFLVNEPGPVSRSKLPPPNRQSLIGLSMPNADGSSISRPPNRPRVIRRSTSDESMLYHSLSRVSSFGDDDRWKDIREQTNSRLKAITDSWDRPTFKLPQLPNIIPAPLKKNSLLGPDQSDSSLSGVTRTSAIFEVNSLAPKDDNMSDLDRALELLTGDIVIMGGYRGSVLRSTRTNRQVWVPVKLGFNIRKVNLEVGLSPEDEERMEETIYASGMLKNIGPVDISKKLFKRIRECENARAGKLRIWDYGYDWRLSPHILSRRLIKFLEQLPSNQGKGLPEDMGAMVIAHSLGGLITRHAVNQRPELFSGVVYAGTPQRCINILGPIRNGDAVLFNEKVLTAQVHFSLRTTFIFLPEDGFCFINKSTGEQYPVDFYDPKEWVKYCWSPCIEPCLPSFKSRTSALASLRELSERLPGPLRSRGNSAASESRSPTRNVVAEATRKVDIATDRTLAPQMGSSQGDSQQQPITDAGSRAANLAYLTRVLADTKRFREETNHRPEHTLANKYPPLAVIYGKEVPTVWAVSVASREAISCADVYDDLVFRSGDGVVLAREAMLPEGYELVKEGRVSTDRGHITMLGDMDAVGKALLAVVRGRAKGIGLGERGVEA